MRKDVFKKGMILGIIILFVGASVVPIIRSDNPVFVDTVYVDDNFNETTPGWGVTHFNKIQDGIEGVDENGEVIVYEGFYSEHVIIDQSIKLNGQGSRDNITIDGNRTGDVIYISADRVTISGFTICNSGKNSYGDLKFDAGIHVNSNNNNIHDNTLSSNHMSILIDNSKEGSYISANFLGNNTKDGIGLYPSSKENTIEDNTITNNEEVGIFVYTSSNNIIKNNTITDDDLGIFLVESSNSNEITYNDITWGRYDSDWPERSGTGIFLLGSCLGNIIRYNNIENNSNEGVELWMMSNNNKFIRNNFVDNLKNIDFTNCIWNEWRENYYGGDWPNTWWFHIIWGKFGPFRWPNFDWYPRSEPWPDYP